MSRPLLLDAVPGPGERLVATDGTVHVIDTQLGRGGQGAVYSLRSDGSGPLCAKVYLGLDQAKAERTRARLERLRQLQATPALVLPRRVLRAPWTGHVMDRVIDAESFTRLANFPGGASIRAWYAETGGLRRRLLLGLALCEAFRDLHLKGLAYCDLSFDNVFASTKGPPAVRLIDCDNLTLGDGSSAVEGTPWFIAPEVLAGTHRPDRETDAHSLAVLLYHLLVLTHPLLGDAIRAGGPEGEEAALRGLRSGAPPLPPVEANEARAAAIRERALPWIDSGDPANRSSAGVPRELVLSKGMRDTFARAFGRGLHERTARPTEGVWGDVLGRAVDAVVGCPSCGNTTWLADKPCAWCKAPVPAPAVLYCAHPDGVRPVVVERGRRLYPRHLLFRQSAVGEAPLAMITVEKDGLVLENQAADPFEIVRGGAPDRLSPGSRARLTAGDTFQAAERAVRVTVKSVGAR
jgi:DNA-binding helix-hairpin-helix protein with protein kinase domain